MQASAISFEGKAQSHFDYLKENNLVFINEAAGFNGIYRNFRIEDYGGNYIWGEDEVHHLEMEKWLDEHMSYIVEAVTLSKLTPSGTIIYTGGRSISKTHVQNLLNHLRKK